MIRTIRGATKARSSLGRALVNLLMATKMTENYRSKKKQNTKRVAF